MPDCEGVIVEMNESIRKYMKVGLIHFMAYPAVIKGEGPIEETLRKIALDDYFEAVEVTWIKDASVRSRVQKMLETAHLDVAYGGQPRLLTTALNINDLDPVGRESALTTLKAGIDEAYEFGSIGLRLSERKIPGRQERRGIPGAGGVDPRALRLCQKQREYEGCVGSV